jgi:hypothetical protein
MLVEHKVCVTLRRNNTFTTFDGFRSPFHPTRVWSFLIIQIDNVPNIICIVRDQIQSNWYTKNSVQLYQRLFKWWNLQSEMLEFENYLISSAQKAISTT